MSRHVLISFLYLVVAGAFALARAQDNVSVGQSMPPEVHLLNVRVENQNLGFYNDGDVPVTITDLAFDADPAFQLTSELSTPLTVGPKKLVRWFFDFIPSQPGTASASFTVTSDSPGSPHSHNFDVTVVDPPLGPWRFVGSPSETARLNGVQIDPQNPDTWYVDSFSEGLYITRDAGETWEHPLRGTGLNREGFQRSPSDPDILYAAIFNRLLRSTDRGRTWKEVYFFEEVIRSIQVSTVDGTIYAGPHWPEGRNPGVYRSVDDGATWDLFSFGGDYEQLICWDIEEDPNDGTLYVPTEIAHHPQPYRPPFFASYDRGETWKEITGELPWHAQKVQVDGTSGEVFVLTESAGLYRRSTNDESWRAHGFKFKSTLLWDEKTALLYAGHFNIYPGGIYISDDRGASFEQVGLSLLRISDVAVDAATDRIIVAAMGAGLFTASLSAIVVSSESWPVEATTLLGHHPNPASGTAMIQFVLARPGHVTLRLYDVLGRAVRTLDSGTYATGRHEVEMNISQLPSGIYAYRLQVGAHLETRMLVVSR